jgi:hypothetical protein
VPNSLIKNRFHPKDKGAKKSPSSGSTRAVTDQPFYADNSLLASQPENFASRFMA